MNISELASDAMKFSVEFEERKASLQPDFAWYPYGTLNNFKHFETLFQKSPDMDLLSLAGGGRIADIGAADGDTAFFLENLGFSVDAIDYPPSNYNSCRGIRLLQKSLPSSITISEVDLDASFSLPHSRYGLAFFLGILYHLKNPYGALEQLSRAAEYALVSTRIAKYNVAENQVGVDGVNQNRMNMQSIPAAYLVAPTETNNDASNFWMFTNAGLKRIMDRCGWDIVEYTTVGDTVDSDPASTSHDERAFALLRSRNCAKN